MFGLSLCDCFVCDFYDFMWSVIYVTWFFCHLCFMWCVFDVILCDFYALYVIVIFVWFYGTCHKITLDMIMISCDDKNFVWCVWFLWVYVICDLCDFYVSYVIFMWCAIMQFNMIYVIFMWFIWLWFCDF